MSVGTYLFAVTNTKLAVSANQPIPLMALHVWPGDKQNMLSLFLERTNGAYGQSLEILMFADSSTDTKSLHEMMTIWEGVSLWRGVISCSRHVAVS